ncbi:alkylmercury lyase family protein [Kribbella sp. NPDC051936]|uniref:alkylmercury lyase family protein n=1 Tax=Kribbella sp. NPDC051936 TaxID=3154946 RepID=UPI00342B0E47
MRLEVLHVRDCPNLAPLLDRLAQVTDLPVATRLIESDADAARYGMAGSPTLLVDGVDPFAVEGEGTCGVSCHLYRDGDGRIVPAPSIEQLRSVVAGSAAQVEVLSAWRRRAIPMDSAQRTAHQRVLRSFAATGQPPDDLPAGVGRALHDLDAIRLTPSGEIAVAYPFSAVPTRHRVRIGDLVDVYAMCAIDALGIAPMLDRDTLIESIDVTTGSPIRVLTRNGRRTWEPAGAVVFVGAEAGGGPSADCCCDYLNFFTDRQSAQAWVDAHPAVPGEVLDQQQAEALADRLFGRLLADNPPHPVKGDGD